MYLNYVPPLPCWWSGRHLEFGESAHGVSSLRIITAHVQEKSSSSSSWGRMLLVQRINKGSEQMQEESSFSSSWGRMLIVQASTKILISASLKRISTNFDVDLPHFQPTTNHPPSIST
ncbi:hypothetical protein V1478_009368 [Vespula squamosa]|uniref:Uncharacterized protein n=1 Tax=Vespula squamosa TaxID=30214 RepID=A0ABD2APR4_VESSQ